MMPVYLKCLRCTGRVELHDAFVTGHLCFFCAHDDDPESVVLYRERPADWVPREVPLPPPPASATLTAILAGPMAAAMAAGGGGKDEDS